MEFSSVLRGSFGVVLLLGIAYAFSNNRRHIQWPLVAKGLLIQLVFAVFILFGEDLRLFFGPLGWPNDVLNFLGYVIVKLLTFTSDGARFVFGRLGSNEGSQSLGFFFAFQVLPTIIFVSCLTSVLYYLGILQLVVKGMAWAMARILGTSGAESLSASANIFVGQTEAPLLIRPFIKGMTQSELLTIMVGGMATIAGGVMASYVQMLGQSYADAQGLPLGEAQVRFAVQLLAASAMAAPAGLVFSKMLYPETQTPETKGIVSVKIEKNASNVIESAAVGAADGLQLALNVGAMLLAFIALIALFNWLLQTAGEITGLNSVIADSYGQTLSIQFLFGFVLQTIAWGIGVPAQDAMAFGSLLGTKVVLNEFVAYLDLSELIRTGALSDKATLMATYALCGFANFSSIAIQIGGIAPLAPNRRSDFAALGLRAILGGSLATLMTATIAGILVG